MIRLFFFGVIGSLLFLIVGIFLVVFINRVMKKLDLKDAEARMSAVKDARKLADLVRELGDTEEGGGSLEDNTKKAMELVKKGVATGDSALEELKNL